ncbi:hypothetical protein CRG98_012699 [Punica granatum]|uniref:Uncharacterized protein n=1 Tax=Punica granatum TaxID=22663 RepID=A0A2I0KGH4_PUNGR|nr:hypothetical protein CRG98_012699 [Punica granatum]
MADSVLTSHGQVLEVLDLIYRQSFSESSISEGFSYGFFRCQKPLSQYSCPRFNSLYCSLQCYKVHTDLELKISSSCTATNPSASFPTSLSKPLPNFQPSSSSYRQVREPTSTANAVTAGPSFMWKLITLPISVISGSLGHSPKDLGCQQHCLVLPRNDWDRNPVRVVCTATPPY